MREDSLFISLTINVFRRISINIALVSLALTAVMVSLGQWTPANFAATAAFISLVIGVLLGSLEHAKEEHVLDRKLSRKTDRG